MLSLVGENGAEWNTGQNETRTLFFVETNFKLVFAEKKLECFTLPQTILRLIQTHSPLNKIKVPSKSHEIAILYSKNARYCNLSLPLSKSYNVENQK
jgi:hypothetical protein